MADLVTQCYEYPPVSKPLANKTDEMVAQYLAMYRTASQAARMLDGVKGASAEWIRLLVNGKPPAVKKRRAADFRGRVHHLAVEMEDDLSIAKQALLAKAVRVYDMALEPRFLKLNPKVSTDVARHILEETGFFNGKGKEHGPDGRLAKYSVKQLESIIREFDGK